MSTRSIKTKFRSATGLLCLDAYILACGGLMLGLTFLCIMGPQVWPDEGASAVGSTQSELSVNAASTLDYSLSISSSGTVSMDLAPNLNGAYASAVDHVRVTTDAVGGYQLYLNTAGSETSLKDPSSNLAAIIPTNGTVTNPAPLGLNSWGFAISSTANNVTNTNFDPAYNTPEPSADSTWAAVPTTQQLIGTSSNPTQTTGDNLDIYYGVYLNAVIPAGEYSNTVVYSALADISPDATTASIFPTTGNYHEETKLNIAAPLAAGTGEISDVKVTFAGQLTNASHICSDIQYRTTTDTLWATCTVPRFVAWDKYDVSVQVSADIDQSYTADSDFTILKNNSAPTAATPLTNGMYMQEMAPGVCASTPTWEVQSKTYLLEDARDGLQYPVRKLKDGSCWMMNNLAITGPRILSSVSSDIASSWSLPASDLVGTQWDQFSSDAHIITGQTSLINVGGVGQWAAGFGNYYTWGAAVAGEDNTYDLDGGVAPHSLCPRNWQIPNSTGQKSLQSLASSYGADTSSSGSAILTSDPIALSFAGVYDNPIGKGYMIYMHQYGWYWTNQSVSATHAYAPRIYTTGNNATNPETWEEGKGWGRSIRCVAR